MVIAHVQPSEYFFGHFVIVFVSETVRLLRSVPFKNTFSLLLKFAKNTVHNKGNTGGFFWKKVKNTGTLNRVTRVISVSLYFCM